MRVQVSAQLLLFGQSILLGLGLALLYDLLRPLRRRGRRITALLDGLAPLRGKRHVLLEVDGGNERARRLYASSGFTVRRLVEYYSLPLLQAAPSGA